MPPVITDMRAFAGQYPRYGYRTVQVFVERAGHLLGKDRMYRLAMKDVDRRGTHGPRRAPQGGIRALAKSRSSDRHSRPAFDRLNLRPQAGRRLCHDIDGIAQGENLSPKRGDLVGLGGICRRGSQVLRQRLYQRFPNAPGVSWDDQFRFRTCLRHTRTLTCDANRLLSQMTHGEASM